MVDKQGKIDQAFILAAGLGTRMRPLTDSMPKPLVKLGPCTLLDHCLTALSAAGVKKYVINLHYFGDQIKAHLADYTNQQIIFSHEDTILETGGGAFKALPHFENSPFFMINGDAFWQNPKDVQETALTTLDQAWNDKIMDCLLLLQPLETMTLTEGVGDYDLYENGQAVRSKNKSGRYMFTGLRIVHPRVFQGKTETPFSFLQIMDAAEANQRLYAVIHKGDYYHISTPEDRSRVEQTLFPENAGKIR